MRGRGRLAQLPGRRREAAQEPPPGRAAALVGVLDGATTAEVGPDGTVHAPVATVRPWVGAEDRWYRFDREVAVRQRLPGGAPVVETVLRVPGGDVVWRVYGARPAGGGDALVVELENASRVPVALALVVEDGPGVALGSEGSALWAAGPVGARAAPVRAGSEPPGTALLVGARAPAGMAGGDDLDGLFTRVAAGVAVDDGSSGGPGGGAEDAPRARFTALVHPVTHGSTSRFVLPLDGPPLAAGALAGAPPHDNVARGWRRMLDSACRVEVPEPTWEEALASVRAQLVLRATATATATAAGTAEAGAAPRASARRRGPAGLAAPGHLAGPPGTSGLTDLALAVRALDAWGHHDEAGRLLAALSAELPTSTGADVSAGFLLALHHRWRITGDEGLPAAAVEDVAHAVAVVGHATRRRRGGLGRWRATAPGGGGRRASTASGAAAGPGAVVAAPAAAIAAAAELLAAAGQAEAATELGRHLDEAGEATARARPALSADAVEELLRAASPTWSWPEPWLGARLLLAVRAVLAGAPGPTPRPAPGGGLRLELLPGWLERWRGQGLEVHDLPVDGGRLSYALRWHGERPALLWEVEAALPCAGVTLCAPALDPAWRGTTARGEALLAAPPLAAGRPSPPERPGGDEFS